MAARTKNYDVIISGAGVPGLALALLLGGLGMDVALVDPVPPPASGDVTPDGRTAALMAGSVNMLDSAGIWKDCAPHGAALTTLRIIESDSSRVDFHAADIGLPYFGINMPNGLQRAIMAEAVKRARTINFLTPAAITGYDSDAHGVTVTLDNGETLRGALLVGADGRGSVVREQAGIALKEHDSGQRAITCLIDHTKPHDNISTEFHRPGGPFTIVPLPGNRSSIVWVEYESEAEAMIRLRRDDFIRALQERTDALVGRVDLATPPQCWPLVTRHAHSLTAPRVALMAEAAHVLHPLGAQGLNLSLRDAATLAEEIADAARRGLDIGSDGVLQRYAFRRRADIMTRLAGTNGLNRAVSNDIGWLRNLRGLGLKTVESIAPLRRFVMQEGVLPGYDDSRLSRGEAL